MLAIIEKTKNGNQTVNMSGKTQIVFWANTWIIYFVVNQPTVKAIPKAKNNK